MFENRSILDTINSAWLRLGAVGLILSTRSVMITVVVTVVAVALATMVLIFQR